VPPRRDLPGYYRLNRAIHERINAAARNPILTQVYRSSTRACTHCAFRRNFDRAKWDAALVEHEQMLAALDKRDGERLRRILVEHLAKKCVAAVLAVMGPAPVAAPTQAGKSTGAPAHCDARDASARGGTDGDERTRRPGTWRRGGCRTDACSSSHPCFATTCRSACAVPSRVNCLFDAASRGRYATDASIYQVEPIGRAGAARRKRPCAPRSRSAAN